MSRITPWVQAYGVDVLLVLLALGSAVDVAVRHDVPGAPASPLRFTVPVAAALVLPLLARRRFPFAAPASVWVLAGLVSLVEGRLVAFSTGATVAGIAAAFLLGRTPDPARARIGLAVVLGGSALVVREDPLHAPADLVLVPVMFVVAWTAGWAVRAHGEAAATAEERARRAEHDRQTAARLAVAEERARIARELHDVVGHAVSVMVLSVGAVRPGLPESLAAERETLREVERVGRAALAEVRLLLGALRGTDDEPERTPQPGLAALDTLVDDVRRAGLPVRLTLDADGAGPDLTDLPAGLDLAAYRVVQEGLTNVLKHASAPAADVVVRRRPDLLEVTVRDDGRSRPAADAGNDGG
ncbi:MAG TPA: histidine kinase, partial [Kineosporiaceae bacterium]|nr:histidine kinase [Kineosporiaceae bacterium]